MSHQHNLQQTQSHPLTKNKACTMPKHQANTKRTPLSDTLKFKSTISNSTQDETREFSSELYLFSDGTFDYSISAYCANDEMGGSYTNNLHGVWQFKEQNGSRQFVMVPHYQQNGSILKRGEWQHFHQTARNNLVLLIENDNFETSLLAWSPTLCYTPLELENATTLSTVKM